MAIVAKDNGGLQSRDHMTDPGASFRQRVRAGEVLLGTFLQLGSPVATEITAQAGFDWAKAECSGGNPLVT